MQLRKQLAFAAENFGREEEVSPVLIPTRSKNMDELPKLDHMVIDVADRLNRKICVTLLRWSLEKPETSYAQIQFLATRKEDETFQQVFYVNCKLEENI